MSLDSADSTDYEALYREFAPKVLAVARRRLAGQGVPEDVVQEVFIRAFVALPGLDTERPLWPWLRRVTVNVCTDVLRSPRTWAEQPMDELPESAVLAAAAPGVDPVSRMMADEQRQAIADALDTLAPRQREILLRRVVDGTSSEEMAASEGSSIEAVKSAVKRGRHGFRRAYTDIASERGLLGGAPPAASAPDRLLVRLRTVFDACARVCSENPVWQSVPVAVAAAVVALGVGAVHQGQGVAEAAAGPWGRDGGGVVAELARSVTAESSPGSSSATTRPGGGAPPAPSSGHDRPGGDEPKATVAGLTFGQSPEDPDPVKDQYWIGARWALLPDQLGPAGEGFAGTHSTLYCERDVSRALLCYVLFTYAEERVITL
jgi:RNA polymerase sigma-70 factor, ECF subfamily